MRGRSALSFTGESVRPITRYTSAFAALKSPPLRAISSSGMSPPRPQAEWQYQRPVSGSTAKESRLPW